MTYLALVEYIYHRYRRFSVIHTNLVELPTACYELFGLSAKYDIDNRYYSTDIMLKT